MEPLKASKYAAQRFRESIIGEGGNFERPLALVRNEQGVPAGTHVEWL